MPFNAAYSKQVCLLYCPTNIEGAQCSLTWNSDGIACTCSCKTTIELELRSQSTLDNKPLKMEVQLVPIENDKLTLMPTQKNGTLSKDDIQGVFSQDWCIRGGKFEGC
jgi:hypothetical protein